MCILARIPCGVLVVDEHKRIVYANERIGTLVGTELDTIVASDLGRFDLGACTDEGGVLSEQWVEGGGGIMHMRTSMRTAGGARVPVFLSGARYRDSSGKSMAYLCIVDISHFEEWTVDGDVPPVLMEYSWTNVEPRCCCRRRIFP
ncbi:MAG: PAS domain-containing protein [Chitinivibrionales bacterium]|nr:PAS domain-containing protein [Chitinivibrionales bacterium]MBD3355817.1 PAS domain-containing protein [Chitinivibrionales bacterium]